MKNEIKWINNSLFDDLNRLKSFDFINQPPSRTVLAVSDLTPYADIEMVSVYSEMLGTFIGFDPEHYDRSSPKLILIGLDKQPADILFRMSLSPLSRLDDQKTLNNLRLSSHRTSLLETLFTRFGTDFSLTPLATIVHNDNDLNIYLLKTKDKKILLTSANEELTVEKINLLKEEFPSSTIDLMDDFIKIQSSPPAQFSRQFNY